MEPERVRKSRNNCRVHWRESLTHLQSREEYFGFPNVPKASYGALVTDQLWFRAKFYNQKRLFYMKGLFTRQMFDSHNHSRSKNIRTLQQQ